MRCGALLYVYTCNTRSVVKISIICGIFDRGWSFCKLCKCDGAVGVVIVLSCGVSYAFVCRTR